MFLEQAPELCWLGVGVIWHRDSRKEWLVLMLFHTGSRNYLRVWFFFVVVVWFFFFFGGLFLSKYSRYRQSKSTMPWTSQALNKYKISEWNTEVNAQDVSGGSRGKSNLKIYEIFTTASPKISHCQDKIKTGKQTKNQKWGEKCIFCYKNVKYRHNLDVNQQHWTWTN